MTDALVESRQWYYARGRQRIGPISWARLRELAATNQLAPADMVLAVGAQRWVQALSVEGLFPFPNTLTSPGAPPPSGGATSAQGTVAFVPQDVGAATLSLAGQADTTAPRLPAIPGHVLLGELGRGGMGVVYLAEHVRLKRRVALKMLLGGAVAGPEQLDRFRSEAEAVARLQHPGIVQVFEVGEHDGLPFISLEYCAGGSLAQQLDGTPLPPRDAARLVEVLAGAAQAAHERHIVHRDLKPSNVLLQLAPGGPDLPDAAAPAGSRLDAYLPKIADFGVAKKLDASQALTGSGAALGTPSYMAPEQASGHSRDLGPAADIYSLGAILYELLTGRPPFKGATPVETMMQVTADEPVPPSRLQPKVAPDLEAVCLKCLEKSPARRYATARALAEDLRRFRAGEPTLARPAGRLERCWKWAQRRPTAAALVAVSALALLTVLVGSLYFTVRLGRERDLARKEQAKAEENEKKAVLQEQLTAQERTRAEAGEADARRELDRSRRSLFTAQLWRVAGLMGRDPFQSLALLQDEKSCPPDLRDFSWRYLQTVCRRSSPQVLAGHHTAVSAVAVAPDGKTLASAGADGTVRLWSLATRTEKATLRGHDGPVHAVAFSPDGAWLASGGADRTIRFWDVAAERQDGPSLESHTGEVRGLAFSPNGKLLASGSGIHNPKVKYSWDRLQHGEVRLWDVPARKVVKLLLPRQNGAILCVAFSPDGRTVAAGATCNGDPSYVFVIDATTGQTRRFSFLSGSWNQALGFSPDGRTLAIGTADHAVNLYDVASKKTRLELGGHQDEVESLAWSPDGKALAAGAMGGRIILWDVPSGRERLTLKHDGSTVRGLAYTPDGATLIAGHDSGGITTWNLEPPRAETYPGPTGYCAVALSADSAAMAAGTREKTVRLWDLATGKSRTLPLGNCIGRALAYSPGGQLLAVGVQRCEPNGERYLPGGECQLWDLKTDKRLATFDTANKAVFSTVFSQDGNLLLTGDESGQVRRWDVQGRHEAGAPLTRHPGPVLALELSPDGRALASAGGGEVALWDLAQGCQRCVLQGHAHPVTCLGFLDGGLTLASAGKDSEVKLWDVANHTLRDSLPVAPAQVLSLAVSQDGQTLALGCQDRTVKLLDVRSRQVRAVLEGHTREVNAVAFSRDGRLLVSAAAANAAFWVRSGEIKVWQAAD